MVNHSSERLDQHMIEALMTAALREADEAMAAGEVPVGAIVSVGGTIIAQAHNRVEERHDATAHAEILALRSAGEIRKNWRLEDAILVVTLEPCTMCTGAILNSRIGTVVFGATDPRAGALGSLFDLSVDRRIGPEPRVIRGVGERESAEKLKQFFAARR